MLVSRKHDPKQNHWSMSKFEALCHSQTSNPRMSHHYDAPVSTQSDWQGQQYSYLPPGDNPIYIQSYNNGQAHNNNAALHARPRSAADSGGMDIDIKSEAGTLSPALSQRRSEDSLGLRAHKQPSPIPEQEETQEGPHAPNTTESVAEGSVASVATSAMSRGSNLLRSASSTGQSSERPASQTRDDPVCKQEEDDELIDDDDMDEVDVTHEMTPAERTAARRKMKRFRLTHQQTRFLMSEFAKQPHPDAAHRERLSREIPGLSPRQVQVWFQNRRAKIKRLTVDDRERMIKMRAVPDDFDNIQALHSPYGAVHGLSTPMGSPVNYGPGSYGEQLLRTTLVVDVRRAEGGDSVPSSGLSPAFGGIAFPTSASMSNPDLMSPMSHESSDRYDYSGHLTPLSAGPRTSNPFTRQSSLDTGLGISSHHSQQPVRPLQPLQLRETLNRSRSDTLQSPLRSSMSWKGDSIDYTAYHGGGGSPQPLSGRQASVYQPTEPTSMGAYEPSNYAGSTVSSPTHMGYPNFSSNSFLNSQQNRSRLRAASATLPLGLDLSSQRPFSGAQPLRSATSPTHRHVSATSAPYTTSFPTAPLTAPSDFNLPRTPSFPARQPEYSLPQMSAPIAPSNDFSQAFQASMTSSARTPMRDSFIDGILYTISAGIRRDDIVRSVYWVHSDWHNASPRTTT
ncbi:hypothetical protein M406DRAFT_336503 [Cryphonectria parasitica EP155]|uniref:Homeobox domain-containing protein n=1 Tax=Cryphonectria parasitica (strain ATCC 38755 / EP155) TaxID=660469 RepID=A0A9P4YEC7_CRYP1|nr:uncharacterized protein M406DRAFT_336503 [Cryphonectria parasitica EP155]KAF3770955.1 hypothetical protein M406DRAFT_336503 [Cryphonectria parasitica EP155]